MLKGLKVFETLEFNYSKMHLGNNVYDSDDILNGHFENLLATI